MYSDDDSRDDPMPSGVLAWQAAAHETSWERVARWRRLRAELDREIKRTQVAAILDSRAAGVATGELAAMWKVTNAMIYTLAPVKNG
ncbi:hypothetical protein ACFXGA_26975 [Actinosynnema sp. NPDC059335]|uniref:hypothetical protein n=1 Tax=Actinosynnema sp. NPDC059335 TaxID=3346804 RepID=UPI003672D313